MTIASCGREVNDLIKEHSVYGVETVLNAIARASMMHPHLGRQHLYEMLDNALQRAVQDYKKELRDDEILRRL